jgi:thymidylate synthase ThyX
MIEAPGTGRATPIETTSTSAHAANQTFPPRRIYSLAGVPPEIQAYGMAKYSRSAQGMLESIRELSEQKAAQFLESFYFQYGHRSIADLAHVAFGLEQISLLAAIEVVDEQVWDGQERSTRYQPFRKTGWFVPPEIGTTDAGPVYRDAVAALFATYDEVSARLRDVLIAHVPRPAALDDASYRRTLRARAFDVARYLLPLATHTSVGQIVSARVLERQISRLLTSRYPELREIGRELRQACETQPELPLLPEPTDPTADVAARLRVPVAPTLVKYTAPVDYVRATERELADAARGYLGPIAVAPAVTGVELAAPALNPLDEIVTTALYQYDRDGHSYGQIATAVDSLSAAQKQEIFTLSIDERGKHDELLRLHQAGYALIFDVLMDVGSYRDLHRHRRCVQVRQPYTLAHGYDAPSVIFPAGLGGEAAATALQQGIGDVYANALEQAGAASDVVRAIDPLAADYLTPLANRVRCLFKLDWAEAAYLIELRTAPAGHFSYRQIAWQMYERLRERYPVLAAPIRATNPYENWDLLKR